MKINNIQQHFHVATDDWNDVKIYISVDTVNNEMRRKVWENIQILFEDQSFTYKALPLHANTTTLSQKIILQKKKK